MKINTKVVFEWNPKSKQYEEIYCDSYEYDGEVAECQYNPWENQQGGMFGQQGGMFGQGGGFMGSGGYGGWTALQQPNRPNTRNFSDYRTYGGPHGSDASMIGDMNISNIPIQGQEVLAYGGLAEAGSGFTDPPTTFAGGGQTTSPTASTTKQPGWLEQNQGKITAAGAGLGAISGFIQAKSQKKGLGAAIKELDPLKGKYMQAHKRQLGLAEAYRPGGRYSQYMGGQIMSQAAESAGQESQRMVASGITSPSMMRAMAKQSRRSAQAAMPGMELQLSQMALPYEQMGAGYLQQYGGVVEQLASLKGARSAINPMASAISGFGQGATQAATMAASFMSDRRMKKDIKYLHTSNEGHKVYSFKYKDGDTKYSGVMAQDVLKINPNAVTLKNGMFAVHYDMIDVDMQQLDII